MKNLFKIVVVTFAIGSSALTFTRCSDGENPPPPVTGENVLEGTYKSDLILDANKVYTLRGFVYIQSPATLTIPAGTVIKGEKSSKGTLIIERGAKINAQGTAANPIIFTSSQPVGSRSYGDWGGIVIVGRSTENQAGSPTTEGGTDRPAGGSDATDNSGILSYVRIEFPGIALAPNSEINGLSLYSVGSGTQIDHVQVSYSGDDAFEWFGGTVNVKNIISHRTFDDDFDTDFGYTGNVQYGVALRDLKVADQSSSNGFESDNDGTGTAGTPKTAAVFSNMSVFGHYKSLADVPGASALIGRGAYIRRNSSISIFNTVITGYNGGIMLDGATTQTNMENDELVLRNITLAGNVRTLDTAKTDLVKFDAKFNAAAANNTVFATVDNLKLNAAAFNLDAPNFLPNNDSPLLNSGDFSHQKLQNSFFTSNTFRGAFGTSDWTIGWANFNPQVTIY